MGLSVTYSANDVAGDLSRLDQRVREKVAELIEDAADDIGATIATLAPMKTGTLENSVYVIARNRSWRVWIDLNQRVPGTKRTKVGDYAFKIESGNFNYLRAGSLAKEATLDRRYLAGKRVEKSSFGTYVGDYFFARGVEATMPKWTKKIKQEIDKAVKRQARLHKATRSGRR